MASAMIDRGGRGYTHNWRRDCGGVRIKRDIYNTMGLLCTVTTDELRML